MIFLTEYKPHSLFSEVPNKSKQKFKNKMTHNTVKHENLQSSSSLLLIHLKLNLQKYNDKISNKTFRNSNNKMLLNDQCKKFHQDAG